jgi:hypothetical protein
MCAHVCQIIVFTCTFGAWITTDVERFVDATALSADIFVDALAVSVQHESVFADTSRWSWSKSWTWLTVWVAACWLTRIFVLHVNFVLCAFGLNWTFVSRCADFTISYKSRTANAAIEAELRAGEVRWIRILASVLASSVALSENFIFAAEFRTRGFLHAFFVLISDKSRFAKATRHAVVFFTFNK